MITNWTTWLETVPFSKELGIEILEVKEGYAKGCIRAEKLHENQYGGIHGGALFTLADTVTGAACLSNGHPITTVDADIHYLSAAPAGRTIYCEAKKIRQGRTLGVYEGTLYGEDGKVYAVCTVTFYIM